MIEKWQSIVKKESQMERNLIMYVVAWVVAPLLGDCLEQAPRKTLQHLCCVWNLHVEWYISVVFDTFQTEERCWRPLSSKFQL